MADSDSNTRTLQIEEQVDVEHIPTTDYFFSKVGGDVSITSDQTIFDASNPPSVPLVISQRFGVVFAAHSSGFCVAETKDVVAAAKEIKDKGSGPCVQELSVVDVAIGRVSILALSIDSSVVSAVVGGEIHCFLVELLLKKDKKPAFSCSVESNHVKDMIWIKDMESSFILLTNSGELHLGAINNSPKHVMDQVDAVGRSVDGKYVAVGRKNNLSVFSSKFKEEVQISLPTDTWTDERDTVKVDSIRWVRSDSIVVGCFQQTEDGMEKNYFIQVITSKDGKIIDGSSKLTSVNISDLFLGFVDDIVPRGYGPHLFVNYLENCEFAFVSNRKNTDQHIMLFDWTQGDNRVSVIEIERDDNLTPRILLQENGDDNLVLGLCVDESLVSENVKVNLGDEEERVLPSHCLLACITLEGKLVMFNVASIAGSQRSSQALSASSLDVQNTSVVGPSDLGEAPLPEEVEKTKLSGVDSELHESDVKEISSALDKVPVIKEQKPFEQKKYTPGILNFDQNIRKELVAGNNNQKAEVDVNNSKPLGHLGKSREGTANQFSFKKFQEGLSFGAGDTVATEKWKIERGVSLTDKSLEKSRTDRGLEETIGSGELNSTSIPTSSGGSLGSSGVSNVRSLSPSPALAKSTLSGSPFSSTDTANSSARFTGNFGSRLSDPFNSSTGKAANHSQKPIVSSALSGIQLGFPSSKLQLQESAKSQNFTDQSVHQTLGNNKKSSPLGQLNPEHNLLKQFSNVQNMANELDKLLESIEKAGGFRDACTTAHRSSLEALEEGMDSLSERNREWQSSTEGRLREVQLLLDKTVQVLARKTHMEGIVRQTTDGQYWDLWNRQKLNSELDQKRDSVLNRSQDLINRMIELEKHFNTLELNLYGESSGVNSISRARNSRSVPSRHSQSLHAIHNATISQLTAAKQLSESLSKQMTVLSIKSPPTKQANVKRQVFESIGIPYPDDSLRSPGTAKIMDSPLNRNPLVSCSGETRNASRRIQLSGVSSHDLETARRRRDSLDRNWGNFEAPKTTVKRMVVQNESQKVGGLFSSMDKQFVSPCKLEGSTTTSSKVLAVQDRNEHKGALQKVNSDTAATSKFKWDGGIPELPQAGMEQPLRWKLSQGDSFSATQSMSSSSIVDPNLKKGYIRSNAERQGTRIGNNDKTDRPGTASADTMSSVLQFSEAKSTTQKTQPRLFSFSTKGGQTPISGSEQTVAGQSFSNVSTSKQDIGASPPLIYPPVSSSISPNLSMQTLPVTSVEGGSVTSPKKVLQFPSPAFSVSFSDASTLSSLTSRNSKEVLQFPTPAIPVSAPQAELVISVSSKGTELANFDSTESSVNPSGEPSAIGPEAANNKVIAANNLATAQSPEKLAPSSDGLNFVPLMPSASTEAPKVFDSSLDMNKTATHVSGMVSNTPEKKSAAVASSSPSPSELGGSAGGKSNNDDTVAQEDEMEEEAPETNQTADFSLGSLAGFGIGSAPSATAPKSNPFGGPMTSTPQTMPSSVSLTVPSGELFRPASFSFQPLQASQSSQPASIGTTSGTFGFTNPLQQSSSGNGFGQPSQIGSGQQALGSVLGSFGQSRQLGAGLPGSGFGIPQSPGGGFLNASTAGGFAGIGSTPSGFGGGFATAATVGGGFAAAATGGGFAAAAPSGGGFAAAPPSGAGFAAAGGGAGGFGAFGKPGSGGFSGFAGGTGGRQAPSELFTQMRK